MIICGDCLQVLKTLDAQSIQCVITSPPYYGLRDYGTAKWEGGDPNCDHLQGGRFSDKSGIRNTTLENVIEENAGKGTPYKDICGKCGAIRIDDQIGLEQTPDEYVQKLVDVFREVKRVLREDGTLWLNLGDSYAGSGNGSNDYRKDGASISKNDNKYGTHKPGCGNLKPKDLIGIPWRVAFALQSDGWYLRSDIIWHKPNPMPESAKDRPTKSHEYIFLLSKSDKYYYDYEAILESANYDGRKDTKFKGSLKYDDETLARVGGERWLNKINGNPGRNKRDVWTVNTKPFKEAHFAVFPEKLITPCVLAGCPEGNIVLDPFCGSGTTGIVCARYNRKFIGIDLNQNYVDMANKRIGEVKQQLMLKL